MTAARRWSEQVVAMVSPATDDRIRALAAKHGVPIGKAVRVALECSLRGAEMLDAEMFESVHVELEHAARRRHLDCSGGYHRDDPR
jgi:hypothetical protein